MAALARLAVDHGCSRIEWLTVAGKADTAAFYDAIGSTAAGHMASRWTATAASASASEPDAVISRQGAADTHSGTRAGTSISPRPCSAPSASDHNARPVDPATRRARPGRWRDPWTQG